MALTPYPLHNFVDDSEPDINALHLNEIDQGIKDAIDGVNSILNALTNQLSTDQTKFAGIAVVNTLNTALNTLSNTVSALSGDAYWKRINASAVQGSNTVTIPANAKEIRVCITYSGQLWANDIQTSLLTGTSQIVDIGGNYYDSTNYSTVSANISTTSVQMRLVWVNGVQQRDSSYMVVFYK